MRLIELPTILTIILDIFAWLFFHLTIAKASLRIKDSYLIKNNFMFKIYKFEASGLIYEKLFLVNKWKNKLPDGSKVLKEGFSKNKVDKMSLDYFKKFLIEVNRAELSHWLQMLPAPLFFLFNLPIIGYLMIVYAALFNLPFIIAQRYNRPKIIRIINKLEENKKPV
jgi:glycosyl-4,4'-diaponeurosporenoate acyltransferase